MSNRAFLIFVSIVAVVAAITGYRLSKIPGLQTYKLINIAGLIYDFLGVVVLSELLASSARWKQIAVNNIAPAVLWIQFVFPLGALIGAFFAGLLTHSPSARLLCGFAFSCWVYSITPINFLDAFVAFPPRWIPTTLEGRWRRFGLFLLLSGVGLQLIAAILGLKA